MYQVEGATAESDANDRGIKKTRDKELKNLYEGDQIRLCIWQQIVKPIVDALNLKVSCNAHM